MPFDPKMPMGGMPDDPEETEEQDATSAAFDAIRASIDQAEQSLMTSKFQKPAEDDAEGGMPSLAQKGEE
jgi:hypothetical protein